MPPSVETVSAQNGTNGAESKKVTPFRYTASAAFLDTLIVAGVKYLFVNLGTDHPGLVEVFANASLTKRKNFPRVLTCPNEMVALTVAHTYAQITGECQAVLLHVETGTLAMAGALHNAAKSRSPVLIWAGASPSTIEGEVLGGRTEFIQFQQDVHDQRGIVRGYVKYNNEMRYGANVPQLVLRSLQIAKSAPAGPVYLMGAREVMESDQPHLDLEKIQPHKWKPLGRLALADEDAQTIAEALATAKQPLIITSYAGKDQRNVPLLVELAETLGCGVLESIGAYVNFPASHWAHLGSTLAGRDLEGHMQRADVILVLETDVPWVPHHNKPRKETFVYQIDMDPLKEQMPMHYLYTDQSFRADGYTALKQLLSKVKGFKTIHNREERIKQLKVQHEKRLEGYKSAELLPSDGSITVQYFTAQVRERLSDKESIIINEATTNLKFVSDHLLRDEPGSLYSSPAASLGWSGGAAIAAKLAHPEKVVATIAGDGSYLFTVPSTVHWMANRYNTPFLTIILNNRGWRAPKGSCLALYPNGQASIATADDIHCSIDPPPDYAGIAHAAGNALGIKVETPEEVGPALDKALEAVRSGRQALLDVWLPKF